MIEAFIASFMIIELLITLGVTFYIILKAEEYQDINNFVLSALGDYIKNLFVKKNWFGIILSLPIFIISIPAFLLLLFIEVIMWIVVLCTMIWNLGNKEEV
jgi:hypothetical protein